MENKKEIREEETGNDNRGGEDKGGEKMETTRERRVKSPRVKKKQKRRKSEKLREMKESTSGTEMGVTNNKGDGDNNDLWEKEKGKETKTTSRREKE